jgi:hypothetical protein
MANLVFDAPKNSRGVKGSQRPGDEDSTKLLAPLFGVKCILTVTMSMGFGRSATIFRLRVFFLLSLKFQQGPGGRDPRHDPPPQGAPYPASGIGTSSTPSTIPAGIRSAVPTDLPDSGDVYWTPYITVRLHPTTDPRTSSSGSSLRGSW